MVFPDLWWIPVAVSVLLCCMGFYRFVWFMTVGYGLSCAGIGLTMLVMALAAGQAGWLYILQCVLFIIYGIRLGGFLLLRELKNARYREKMRQVGGDVEGNSGDGVRIEAGQYAVHAFTFSGAAMVISPGAKLNVGLGCRSSITFCCSNDTVYDATELRNPGWNSSVTAAPPRTPRRSSTSTFLPARAR